MKKSILFVINPNAGTLRNKGFIKDLVDQYLSKDQFESIFEYTKYAGHGIEIAKKATEDKIDIVVAVGGDGTVNEIASVLAHTNTALAIIPMGSGNGLARHLGLPMNTKKAIKHINKAKLDLIDVAYLNEKPFLCTAGIGFDALVSHKFAQQKSRGLWTYIKVAIKQFRLFKSFRIKINNQLFNNTFLVTVANANQYGNDTFIAPNANISDGLLELVHIKKPSLLGVISLAISFFQKRIDKNKYCITQSVQSISLPFAPQKLVHIDGEPIEVEGKLDFSIQKEVLKVFS